MAFLMLTIIWTLSINKLELLTKSAQKYQIDQKFTSNQRILDTARFHNGIVWQRTL